VLLSYACITGEFEKKNLKQDGILAPSLKNREKNNNTDRPELNIIWKIF